jgi:hypothetical protein
MSELQEGIHNEDHIHNFCMKLFENHLEKRSANRKEEMNALEKSN